MAATDWLFLTTPKNQKTCMMDDEFHPPLPPEKKWKRKWPTEANWTSCPENGSKPDVSMQPSTRVSKHICSRWYLTTKLHWFFFFFLVLFLNSCRGVKTGDRCAWKVFLSNFNSWGKKNKLNYQQCRRYRNLISRAITRFKHFFFVSTGDREKKSWVLFFGAPLQLRNVPQV